MRLYNYLARPWCLMIERRHTYNNSLFTYIHLHQPSLSPPTTTCRQLLSDRKKGSRILYNHLKLDIISIPFRISLSKLCEFTMLQFSQTRIKTSFQRKYVPQLSPSARHRTRLYYIVAMPFILLIAFFNS